MTEDGLRQQLKDALSQGDITLILANADNYREANIKVLNYLTNEREFLGIHVTVNKPYQSIKQGLEKIGADLSNVFFIDAISHELGADMDEHNENAVFLESPHDLTNLSIVTSEVVESLPQGKKFILFDSLSALTIYHSLEAVTEFSHQLIGKMRNWNTAGILVSLEEEVDEELTAGLSEVCDDVIRI